MIPGVRVTLMLADYAQVSNGKLTLVGGGWSQMTTQGPFGFWVGGVLQVPWDQANAKHTFRLDLLDADGKPIPTGEGDNTLHVDGEFELGRPAGIKPGTPLDFPLAFPFGPLVLEGGRYELRLSIDGETREDWYLAFTLTVRPS